MKKGITNTIIAVIIVGFIAVSSYNDSIYGKKYNFNNEIITVKKGDNVYKIIEKMKIKNLLFAKLYLKFYEQSANKIETGSFRFDGNYSLKTIIESLEKGNNGFVLITIPEGFTAKQIKKRLAENEIISEADFDKALKDKKDFYYYTPNGNFDGYLFPDTYYFSKGENGIDVINKFLDRFLEKFPPEKYIDKKYFYEKLILASVIEKEAGNKIEMSLVASVFQNRLDKGMKLQSCATVAYLFNYEKDYIYYKDLEIDSPYNTYKYKGLPIGPISNPGVESIKASLNPSKTKYLYFVLGSNGKHHFSETYNEHIEVQKIEKRGINNDNKIRVNR